MKRYILALLLLSAAALPYIIDREVTAQNAEAKVNENDVEVAEEAADDLKALVDKVYPSYVRINGGSGVCISPDGYVLTNHHVAPEATRKYRGGGRPVKISVYMPNVPTPFTAVPVSADPRGDIVLLKIELEEGETVPYSPLADSDLVQPGDIVVAVGNPFLLGSDSNEPSVSTGVVSAISRHQSGYSDVIQVDAAVNPGNSGGPSFNIDGEVIGINGRILTAHGARYNTGLGYAIPSNQIARFLPRMKAQPGGARVIRHALVSGLAMKHDSRRRGCEVLDVREGSTADRAGFKIGDIVTKIDKYRVRGVSGFYGKLCTWPQGATVDFTVQRESFDGEMETLKLSAMLEVPVLFNQSLPWPYPADRIFAPMMSYEADVESDFIFQSVDVTTRQQPARGGGFMAEPGASVKLGVGLSPKMDLVGALKDLGELGVQSRGLEVTSVEEDSAAFGKLKVGDVITHFAGRRLYANHDVMDSLLGYKPGEKVTLKTLNGEVEITLQDR